MALREKENDRLPIPNGWFAVDWSRELHEGDVKPLEYFGEELVLFRTRSGQARVQRLHITQSAKILSAAPKLPSSSRLTPRSTSRPRGQVASQPPQWRQCAASGKTSLIWPSTSQETWKSSIW